MFLLKNKIRSTIYLLILFLWLLLSSTLYAEENIPKYGVLNVFTDLPKAVVYVDSLAAGQESVVKLPLPIGEHYVQVKLDNKLVYAEKVIIKENRSTTVVSEHFVDIITKTPSRGAIDREAARLRESRGDFGLGVIYQTIPQPAASLKWWLFENIGFSALFLGGVPGTDYHGVFGGRLLLSPAAKIFQEDLLVGYLFGGAGLYRKTDALSSSNNLKDSYYAEFGLGAEARIGELVNLFFKWKYDSPFRHKYYRQNKIKKNRKKDNDKEDDNEEKEEEKEDGSDAFRDLVIMVLANISYTSAEVTVIKEVHGPIMTGFNFGFHIYF
ncbi:hypothetical protein ACFLZV_03250 [Candidatus Margulisiibacteriota bacterium]